MNEIIKLLKSHTSIRKFQEKEVEKEKIHTIIQTAQCASTSSFVQAYTIIHVINNHTKKEIAKLSGEQIYIEKCPVFLVFCADLNRLDMACQINDIKMIEGYTESFIIATVDTALAGQNAIIAAESMGLGGVYIGGIRNNPNQICDLLHIPSNVYPVFGMCLGYPAQSPKVKPRLPIDVVLKNEFYTIDGDEEKIKKYDEQISEYYKSRTKGRRNDTWSKQMAEKMSTELRPHMKSFLKMKKFEMK